MHIFHLWTQAQSSIWDHHCNSKNSKNHLYILSHLHCKGNLGISFCHNEAGQLLKHSLLLKSICRLSIFLICIQNPQSTTFLRTGRSFPQYCISYLLSRFCFCSSAICIESRRYMRGQGNGYADLIAKSHILTSCCIGRPARRLVPNLLSS